MRGIVSKTFACLIFLLSILWTANAQTTKIDLNTQVRGILPPANVQPFTYTAFAFSPTPAFTLTGNTIFSMTLTGNVTSSSIVGGTPGSEIIVNLCQDATGGRTFVWPASFLSTPPVNLVANTCQSSTFYLNSSSQWILIDANTLNSTNTWGANNNFATNVAIAGPRPYVDVTAPPYNADPTGTIDSTVRIQSAITAACAISTSNGRPGVYFPPGRYAVTQTQTGVSTTAPVFTTCSDLYLYSNGSQGGSAQFRGAPQGAQITVSAGASPNAAPVFAFTQQENATVENLALSCHNQCISTYDSVGMRFNNDALSVATTGQIDNTPLKITNSFWVWINGGTLQNVGGTLPTLLMTGEASLAGEAPLVGLITVRDLVTAGGGFEYIQRVNNGSSTGSWVFRNVTQEGADMPFLTINETSSGFLGDGVSNLTLDTDTQADCLGGGCGTLVNSTVLKPIKYATISNSVGPITSSGGQIAVRGINWNAGEVTRSGLPANTQLLDGLDKNSFDITSAALVPSGGGNSGPVDCSGLISQCVSGASGGVATRWFNNSFNYSQVGIDASAGVLFGLGDQQGYTAGIQQNQSGSVDVLTAALPAPTNLTGTATTGGSLAAGTYYGVLWATSTGILNGCWNHPLDLSAETVSAGVVVSGANNAVNFTWTAPVAGPTSAVDYCLQVTTSAPDGGKADPRTNQFLTFAAPATTFLYTGQAQTSFGILSTAQTIMMPVHRFGYNWLGVNTLSSGGFNLNVNGTANISGALTVGSCTGCSSAAFYQTMEQDGTAQTQRPALNFISGANATVTCVDNSGSLRTDCTFASNSSAFYQTMQDGGTSQTQRPTLNFIPGSNMTISCVDNSGATRTDCTFTASSTAATAWSSLTPSLNSTGGTFLASGNSWDYSGANSFKVPTVGLIFPGSVTGNTFVVEPATGPNNTLNIPTNNGTFAVSASAPLALDAATGNLTVSNATTGAVGVIQLAGDLANTATSPQVVSTHISGATNNTVPRFNSTGNLVNSALVDNGAIVSSSESVDVQSGAILSEIANAGTTGTTVNKLASLTGAPSTAVITTAGATSGVVGIVTGGAGTTSNAQIAVSGQASCVFDGGTTAGHYVQISGTVNGDCTDAGSTYPSTGQVLGIVKSTNASGGTYAMVLFGPGAFGFSGGGSGTVSNCATSGAIAYYATNGTTVTCLSSITQAAGVINIGTVGSVLGQLTLAGSVSGKVTIQPQSTAGTYNFNLPTSAGSANAPLLSGGGGATAQSYSSILYLTSLTSGGVVYGSSSTQLASSALLPAGDFVLGGGAGSAPTATFSIVPPVNGGTGNASPAAHSLLVTEGSSNMNLITSPTTNGTYVCGFTVTASAAVDPTCDLAGLVTTQTLSGSSTLLTIAYSDNESVVNHDVAASGVGAITLPTPTTLGNSNFAFSYCNKSAQTDVITPTTWTINGASTLNVPQNVCYRIHVDAFNSNNWQADGSSSSVLSVSNGDGTLTISPTTGAVVASLALGHANTWTALQTFGTHISIGGVTAAGATGTGNVVFSASPTLSGTETIGSSGNAGLLSLFPASGNFTTTLGSAATASNTVLFFATAPTNNHLIYCATASTTCTLTDAGYSFNSIPNSDLANSSITIAGTSVSLGGSTTSLPSPGPIGGTSPSTGAFTTLGASGLGTFSSAGAASTPGLTVTGAPFTGGTGTTTVPQFYLNAGTAPTTYSTSGTEFGINAPSGFTGNLFDFHVNGGASVAKLDASGNMTVTSCTGCGSGVTSVTIAGTANQITATGTCTITATGTCTLSLPNAVTLGASGTLGSLAMGNATSGTVTLQPVTGALGSVTASLPANTGTIAELNLAQSWTATQTFSTAAALGSSTATTQSANDNSTKVATTAYADAAAAARAATVTCDGTSGTNACHAIPFSFGTPGGSALSTGVLGYVTVPFACTIRGWQIEADAGTDTVKFLKVAAGTAIPTLASNSINTSGVSLATGTVIQSTTLTDFTTTTVTAGDIMAADLITTSGTGYITAQVSCSQ